VICFVEDEASIAKPVAATLSHHGYEVRWFRRADEARCYLLDHPADLLIVDIKLLDGDNAGFELAHEVRQMGLTMPILMLTARDAVVDRIHGLDVGADDYLSKPFDLDELLARVRALLRRVNQLKHNKLVRGPLNLDFINNIVTWHNEIVPLTPREFALLEVLARNPDRVFSPEDLLDRIWGDSDNSNVLRTYIHYLRNKFSPALIEKVSGGYRLGEKLEL
jgi:two-component system response regulator QseB